MTEGLIVLFILVGSFGYRLGTYSKVTLQSVKSARTSCLPSELDYIKPSLQFRCVNGLEGYISKEDE